VFLIGQDSSLPIELFAQLKEERLAFITNINKNWLLNVVLCPFVNGKMILE
jgi:hypothetical protein